MKIVIFEVNDVELESEIKVISMEKRYKQENSSSLCDGKSFLSLFPVTNSTGSLLFEPTSQLILEDPRAFEWILPAMLKKKL